MLRMPQAPIPPMPPGFPPQHAECRLRPCMHAALCVECAEGLMARGYSCPICSCKIEQVERGAFMRTFTVEEAQG